MRALGPVVMMAQDRTVSPVALFCQVSKTPAGRTVLVCPAQTRRKKNCLDCRLCTSQAPRRAIVGFRVHGARWKVAEAATLEDKP